ncbi:hypothetical protein BH23VER1_BH23VER1_25210 [soil metagenome]
MIPYALRPPRGLLLAALIPAFLLAHASAQIVISEFMAANGSTLADEDGDFSDWIEIENSGAGSVDLMGYRLTDDPLLPAQWVFPSVDLPAGERLLVFASGKDRAIAGSELHTNFALNRAGEYLALSAPDGTVLTSFDPAFPEQFEDVSYGSGLAGPVTTSDFTPATFSVQDPGQPRSPANNYAEIRGSGFLATARDNLDIGSASGQRYMWLDYAAELPDAADYTGTFGAATLSWQGDPATTSSIQWDTGQVGVFPVPDGNYGRDTIFSSPIASDDLLNFYAENTPLDTTTFSTMEETTQVNWDITPMFLDWIANPDDPLRGQFITITSTQPMWVRWPAASGFVGPVLQTTSIDAPSFDPVDVYFQEPTPGTENGTGRIGFVGDTHFSIDRGFFTTPQAVEITCDTPETTIFYTINGSEPSPTNPDAIQYAGPVTISATTALRAAAFRSGWQPSNVDTQTYVFVDDVINQNVAHATGLGFPSTSVNGQIFQYGMNSAVVTGRREEIKTALQAIPTISLVMPQKYFSDRIDGIYVNASQKRHLEQPGSIELINENGSGTGQFQVDCGVRIRGGFSRSGNNPKHAFRFFFRKQYGPGKLRYPLFGTEGTDSFDVIDLRTAQNYSWSFGNDSKNTFLREVFGRDTQRDMGQPYTRSRYYHLYINSHYWGLFQTQERAKEDYGASYFGGEPEDYDVVKSVGNGGSSETPPQPNYTTELTDGTFDAWNSLYNGTLALRSNPSLTNYYALQGLMPDGVTPSGGPVLLDVDNLIDYMLDVFFCGGFDNPLSTFINNASNNWFGIRNRVSADRGFAFFYHDGEHGMGVDRFSGGGVNQGIPQNARSTDRTGPFGGGGNNFKGEQMYNSITQLARSNPQYIHENLAFVEEYRVRFADRAQRHLRAPGGALTVEEALPRVADRAATVSQVIVAESARWGNTSSESTNAWATERASIDQWISRGSNALLNNAGAPGRDEVIISQLRIYRDGGAAPFAPKPLFPSIDAPLLSMHGGMIHYEGTAITITDPNSGGNSRTIYYRTDGTDPRLVGGAVAGGTMTYSGPILVPQPQTLMSRVRDTTTGEWSALTEALFTTGVPASAANVSLTELHYHPADPSQQEIDSGFTDKNEFEFIEFTNTSPTYTVDFTGVRFVDGIVFAFPDGFALAPGQRTLVVKDIAAFTTRYSSLQDPNIAGAFASGQLDNSGERLTVLAANDSVIVDFTYGDAGLWPGGADGEGYSLVYVGPDPALAQSWRTSAEIGGNPGTAHTIITYADYQAANSVGAAMEDDDLDTLPNFIEFVMGTDAKVPNPVHFPRMTAGDSDARFFYTRSITAAGFIEEVEFTSALTGWAPLDPAAVSSYTVGRHDATTELVEVNLRNSFVAENPQLFLRLKATAVSLE